MQRSLSALLAVLLLAMCALGGCSGSEGNHSGQQDINGIRVSFTYSPEYTDAAGDKAVRDDAAMAELDESCRAAAESAIFMTSGESGSPAYELNCAVDRVLDCDTELLSLLSQVTSVSSLAGSTFHPFYGAASKLYAGGEVTDEALSAAAAHIGAELITFQDGDAIKSDRDTMLDCSEFVCGYAAQKVYECLAASGVEYACITVGDVTAVLGEKSRRTPSSEVALYTDGGAHDTGMLKLARGFAAVRSSGGAMMLDCATGVRINPIHRAVIITAADGVTADLLARICSQLSFEEIEQLYQAKTLEFEAVIVADDGSYLMTEGAAEAEMYESTPDTTQK